MHTLELSGSAHATPTVFAEWSTEVSSPPEMWYQRASRHALAWHAHAMAQTGLATCVACASVFSMAFLLADTVLLASMCMCWEPGEVNDHVRAYYANLGRQGRVLEFRTNWTAWHHTSDYDGPLTGTPLRHNCLVTGTLHELA